MKKIMGIFYLAFFKAKNRSVRAKEMFVLIVLLYNTLMVATSMGLLSQFFMFLIPKGYTRIFFSIIMLIEGSIVLLWLKKFVNRFSLEDLVPKKMSVIQARVLVWLLILSIFAYVFVVMYFVGQ